MNSLSWSERLTRVYIYTHTDLDGIGAASVYLRLIRKKYGDEVDYSIQFVEPSNLHLALRNGLPNEFSNNTVIAIMDLGANKSTINDILSMFTNIGGDVSIEWYDHHRWDDEWIEELRNTGVSLYLDTGTCGTGLVYRRYTDLYGEDEDLRYFVDSVCSADLWLWDEWFSPFLYRVVGRFYGSRGDAWKRLLVEEFSRGRFWSDGLSLLVEDYVDKELRGYQRGLSNAYMQVYDDLRIVFLVKEPGPPNNSLMASYLLSKLSADIAVIIREDGSMSFRSKERDVRELAVCMSGGGHPRASGGRVRIPFHYKLLRFISRSLYYKLIRSKVVNEVAKCLNRME